MKFYALVQCRFVFIRNYFKEPPICAAAGAGDPESYYYIFRSKARKEKMGVCVFVFHSRGLFFFPRDLLEKEKKPWERKNDEGEEKLGN